MSGPSKSSSLPIRSAEQKKPRSFRCMIWHENFFYLSWYNRLIPFWILSWSCIVEDKVLELVNGESVINKATTSIFFIISLMSAVNTLWMLGWLIPHILYRHLGAITHPGVQSKLCSMYGRINYLSSVFMMWKKELFVFRRGRFPKYGRI